MHVKKLKKQTNNQQNKVVIKTMEACAMARRMAVTLRSGRPLQGHMHTADMAPTTVAPDAMLAMEAAV